MKATYRTNNISRELVSWDDLTYKQQFEFNSDLEPREESFFLYRGQAYCMGDFMRFGYPGPCTPIDTWEACDSSGMVIKLKGEGVVVGWSMPSRNEGTHAKTI